MKQRQISRKSSLISTFLVLIVIAFFIDLSGLSKVPSTFASNLLRPLQIGLVKTKSDFENFLQTVTSIRGLRQEEKELKVKNATLLAENASLKKLGEENETLRSQLGFKTKNQNLIPASIIGQDPKFLNSQVLIDAGTREGVKKGDSVVFKNILVGKIKTVSETSSTLLLLSDPELKIPAVTESGVAGLVQGNFGNTIRISKVPTDQSLKKDELVFSSGESGFPKNLVIGKIGQVKKNPADIFQEAKIEPLVQTRSLEAVFIIKS